MSDTWSGPKVRLLGFELANRIEALSAENARLRLDADRLDWLEGELLREQFALRDGAAHPRSLFRRNAPITRAAIDASMKREVL